MTVSNPSKPDGSASESPSTPVAAVAGWLLVIFGLLPVLMGAHGDGTPYLVAGAAMTATGAVLILTTKLRRRF